MAISPPRSPPPQRPAPRRRLPRPSPPPTSASKPRTSSLSGRAAAAPARPAAPKKQAKRKARRQRTTVRIADTTRDEVLCVVRAIFARGGPRDRETALHQLAAALGYVRVGANIRETLASDLLAAARRGIIVNERGELALLCRSIEDYDRDFLKDQFVAAVGRTWTDREDAANVFARWLGFARTGPTIHATARSLINGLLRENRFETNGDQVRKL